MRDGAPDIEGASLGWFEGAPDGWEVGLFEGVAVGLDVGWEVGYRNERCQIYHMRGIGSDNIIMDIQWQTSQQLTELVGAAVGLDVGWEVGYIEMKDVK